MNNQKGSVNAALGTFVIGFIFLVMAVVSASFRYDSTSRGSHTGYITAIQERGVFFKNWNVYIKTDNSSSQEDLYCAEGSNPDLVEQLKQHSQERKLVTINYDGVRGFGWHLCHAQKITSVEVR